MSGRERLARTNAGRIVAEHVSITLGARSGAFEAVQESESRPSNPANSFVS